MGVQGVVVKVKYARQMMVVEMVRLDRVIMVVTDEREQWVRMVILVVVVVEVRRK
jgi:hypothetical protein